ncbi:dihydroxy-acid dehydratase [Vallitalea guaymasensis]|uniref:Dihydroxy-acid dehydratase n=1 Tax=Vallitalea guaymasensis TaxID=1185412 RepID=A0A8J8MDK1_9FIRM|nr:dihydroxy-acid dehydratase [Vallitalea guaymasensis]QUH30927.1 dihydroxy-acid dehydratase [Vallitalea guaymasensis]
MDNSYYNPLLEGDNGALKRALYKAMGFTDSALQKPLIGIVNTYTNATPGHYNINEMCEHVQKGIEAAGGTAMTFGTIAPCDGIAEGHEGMRYILPSRDIISSSVECMVRAHRFDGLVLLGSCDKIVPGLLMAAGRLDIPAIFCNGGPMFPASYKGKHYDGNIVTEAIGWKQRKLISEEEFKMIENLAEPCVGSCAMLGTANTMGCMAEAMGMSLPGCATVPAVMSERMQFAYKTGEAILELVKKGITARRIITKESIANAIMVLTAIGGSTNGIMHLQAIYKEAGLGWLPLEVFDEYSRKIPQIASIYPASPYDMVDFYEAGGVPAVLKELEDNLYDCMTVSGKTIKENLKRYEHSNRREVVSSIDEPFASSGGVAILTGNIAPSGAVVKPAAIPENLMSFTGRAKVFVGEEEACKCILSGDVQEGTVVVLAYEGPKGGPGMPEMYRPMKCLEGMNLSSTCALITDGRFSGSNRGCFVGHISPEAYEGGVLGLVKDGDLIEIDIDSRKIELLVDDEELEKRRISWVKREKDIKDGYLNTYKRISKSAAQGAVVE